MEINAREETDFSYTIENRAELVISEIEKRLNILLDRNVN